MKKLLSLLTISAFVATTSFAQSVQEGVSMLYAERNASAKSTFEKILAGNPNNIEANYWLGQSSIAADNIADARSVYQKALTSSNNAPLVRVGMGHVLLLENKPAEARQEFEAAITASRGKKGDDPAVVNAIARANIDAKAGDAAYAIAKLTPVAQANPNNADVLLNLGDAYWKAHKGGEAVTNYIAATRANPKLAVAHYRMGKLYSTQRNWDVVQEHLNSAITADPKFAPAYLEQYYYNLLYKKDFAKADENAKQYIATTDPSVQNDYLRAQTLFVQKNYDEAINIGKNIVSQSGDQVNPRVYRLLAYSTLEKGDTAGARVYVDQFFAKAKDQDLVSQDLTLKADVYAKEDPSIVAPLYLQAAKMDSIPANQLKFLEEGISRFQASGQKLYEAELRLAAYQLRPDPDPARLVHIGLAYYQGGGYNRADSVFKLYTAAAPDSIFGYLWSARSLARIDTAMTEGLAVPAYEKLVEVSGKDKERYKSYGVEASGYLAGYSNNAKKDKDAAIMYLQKGLEFDPTNTAIQNNLRILQNSSRPSTGKTETKVKGDKTKTKTEDGKTKTKTKKKG